MLRLDAQRSPSEAVLIALVRQGFEVSISIKDLHPEEQVGIVELVMDDKWVDVRLRREP